MTPNPKIIFEQTESLKHFDSFVEEQFLKADFPSLSPDEQTAYTLALLKAIMEHICQEPVDFIDIIDKDSFDGIVKTQIVSPPPVLSKADSVGASKVSRHLPNGKYNNKPLDPDYYKKYWRANLASVKVECPRCGVLTGKCKIARHFITKVCMKAHAERLEQAKTI